MQENEVPDRFGEFVTRKRADGTPAILGVGGFGMTVHAFRSRRFGSTEITDEFAIKILRNEIMSDPRRRMQFIDEILALRELQHPNLVRFFDCGEQTGLVYLVMDLCAGGDLGALASRLGPFPEDVALKTIAQVCAGIGEAHLRGYLHRDLKPTNILLSEPVPPDAGFPWMREQLSRGLLRFKVVDFGLAGRMDSDDRNKNRFAGSPMYASPEQVRERNLDVRSDIYSLGMTLWYLVQGKGPLLTPEGKPVGNARMAMQEHTSATPHDARFPKHLSEEFRALLGHMVAKAPEDRFASAGEVAAAIQGLLSEQQDLASQADRFTSAVSKAASEIEDGWEQGSSTDLFEIDSQIGTRLWGKCFRARLRSNNSPVALTAWAPSGSTPEKEKLLARRLAAIWAITRDAAAPEELIPILDVRRTADLWCVAEEWIEGESIEKLLFAHGRSISMEQAARVLFPVATAGDFLLHAGLDSALLSVDAVKIVPAGSPNPDSSWLRRSIEEWPSWKMRVSALALPPELHLEEAQETSGATVSDSFGISHFTIPKAFCRLLYRMVEGTEVPGAADWDPEAFVKATRLSAASNFLLRDQICGIGATQSLVEMLQEICQGEGVYRAFTRPEASATRSRGRSWASGTRSATASRFPFDSRSSASGSASGSAAGSASASGSASGSSMTGARLRVPDPQNWNPASSMSVTQAAYSAEASQALSPALKATHLEFEEVAKLIPKRPGWVQSPYGSQKEQQIEGSKWHGEARIACQETGRTFILPLELPPLEATPIPDRFNAVLSPYISPPREVPVPPIKWRAGAEIVCRYTGRPLRLPGDLPKPVATLSTRFGVVLSPFDGREVQVPTELWKPGATILAEGCSFLLPESLPALEAVPQQAPGVFASPFDPTRTVRLAAAECVPDGQITIDGTPLRIPATLPADWLFEAEVRQQNGPECKSPFGDWQPVPPHAWSAGGTIQCRKTGRTFKLPEALPVLSVDAGHPPPAIRSPFPPHPIVPVPIEAWAPDTEWSLPLGGGKTCRVRLPKDIGRLGKLEVSELDGVPLARNPSVHRQTGKVESPFESGAKCEVQGKEWFPGVMLICPATKRPFWLPKNLPPLEAEPVETAGEIRSPYSGRIFSVPAEQWLEGRCVKCPDTGAAIRLPKTLPLLPAKIDPRRPGWIESPFAPGKAFQIAFERWVPNAVIDCFHTGKRCVLPAELPQWLLEAEPVAGKRRCLRSPYGSKREFVATGPEWEAGGLIRCPETGLHMRLPADLPPLEPTVSKAGSVRTPYTLEANEFKVPRSRWKPGEEVQCPFTKRKMRLPADLPPYPLAKGKLKAPLIVTGALVLIAGLVLVALHFGQPQGRTPGKLSPTPGLTIAEASPIPTAPEQPSATPARPTPELPTPAPDRWPTRLVLKEGIIPQNTTVLLADETGKAVPVEAIARDIRVEIRLDPSNPALAPVLRNAKELHLEFAAPGYASIGGATSPVRFRPGQVEDFTYSNLIQLSREEGIVRWTAPPLFAAFYSTLLFHPIQETGRPSGPTEVPLSSGSIRLHTGAYSVALAAAGRGAAEREIASRLQVQANAPATLPFPQPPPRVLAGMAAYEDGQPFAIYSRNENHLIGDVQMPVTATFHTPLILLFDPNFRSGVVLDENDLLRVTGVSLLDNIARLIYAKEKLGALPVSQARQKSKAVAHLFEFVDAASSDPKDPDSIWKQRERMFSSAASMIALAREKQVLLEEGDLRYNQVYDCLVKLKPQKTGSWADAVAACFSTRPTLSSQLVQSLREKLPVNGKSGTGLFCQQPFTVTSIEPDPANAQFTTVRIQLQVSATDFKNPAVPLSFPFPARLLQTADGFRLEVFDAGDQVKPSRSAVLYPVAGMN